MAALSATIEKRTEKLDLRISRTAKAKLLAAASASHRSMSDFVMESALMRAEETLADRRVFGLDAESWAAFQNALDAPTRTLPKMQQLLNQQSFFEESPGK